MSYISNFFTHYWVQVIYSLHKVQNHCPLVYMDFMHKTSWFLLRYAPPCAARTLIVLWTQNWRCVPHFFLTFAHFRFYLCTRFLIIFSNLL
jgi:hypothetical protein